MPLCSRQYLSLARGIPIMVCLSMCIIIAGNHYLSDLGLKPNIVEVQKPSTRGVLQRNLTSLQHNESETGEILLPKAKEFNHAVRNDLPDANKEENETYWRTLNITEQTENRSFSNEKPLVVLILAYMHTGSSYLGEVVKLPSNTFYLYEPLRALKDKVKKRQHVEFLNRSSLQMSEKVYKHVGGSAIANMFACNFNNLDTSTLTERYTSYNSTNGRDQSDYFRCLSGMNFDHKYIKHRNFHRMTSAKSFKIFRYLKHTRAITIRQCLPKIIERCEKSSIRIIKVIRMSMDMLLPILQYFPNMKIIHLLRDPRAMLDSNVRKNELGVSVLRIFQERTKYMCKRMVNDLRMAERIEQEYPGQIFTLRYEDTVDRPMGVAKQVYDFMRVSFTSHEEEFVRRRSIDSDKNSTFRASRWRHHISDIHLMTVEHICHELFEMLGYKKMGSIANVRNISIRDHDVKLT